MFVHVRILFMAVVWSVASYALSSQMWCVCSRAEACFCKGENGFICPWTHCLCLGYMEGVFVEHNEDLNLECVPSGW